MLNKTQRGFASPMMIMGIVLFVVIAGSAAYFKYSQDKLAEANQLVAAETARAESAEANLEFVQKSVTRQQTAINELAKASAIVRQEQEVVIDLFASHDLKTLAEKKPGLIETRVNKATQEVLDELERITDPLSYEPMAKFIKEEK